MHERLLQKTGIKEEDLMAEGCFGIDAHVDGATLHRMFNHAEHRVLQHLEDALCDAQPWWKARLKDVPCDACLRGDAPLIGPSGSLPKTRGLAFGDIWHCNVPAVFGGQKALLGITEASTTIGEFSTEPKIP